MKHKIYFLVAGNLVSFEFNGQNNIQRNDGKNIYQKTPTDILNSSAEINEKKPLPYYFRKQKYLSYFYRCFYPNTIVGF